MHANADPTFPVRATDDAGHGAPSRPLLEIHDLTKDFGGLRALDHASVSVREGTITGLIGPNGAGKTTLFNVVTGYHPVDHGRVYFDGQDITNLKPHQIFQAGLCRTFQIPREHQSMSVVENLMLVPPDQAGENILSAWFRPGLVRRQEEVNYKRALEVLEFIQLSHVRDEYAKNLSGGQKKLLEIGRTLMTRPRMVLLDEPGAGVNPTLMKRLTENINEINRTMGVTFLVIEHDMDMIMSLCNPVIVMSEGRHLVEGPPDVVRTDARVLEAYLGGQYGAAEG